MVAAANTWGSHPLGFSTQRGQHQGPGGLTSPRAIISQRAVFQQAKKHILLPLSPPDCDHLRDKMPAFRFHSTAQWVQAEKRVRALGPGGVNSKPASAL